MKSLNFRTNKGVSVILLFSLVLAACGGGSAASYSADKAGAAPASAPPPAISLTAASSSITSNASTAITWSSTNSTSCTSPAGGGSGTTGSFNTGALTTPTTFTVTCVGAGGAASQSTTVTVASATGPAAPSVSVSASSPSIAYNANTNINWSSTNSTSCTSPAGGGSGTTGSFNTGALSTTTNYTVTCVGAGGSANQSTTVTVAPQAVTAPPSVIPQPPSLDTVPMPANAIMVNSAAGLTAALQAAVGGETIALASGAYGVFAISNKTYGSTVFVRPQVGATPVFKSFTVTNCKKMQISGLSILPRRMNGDTVGTAVSLNGANEDIIFEKSLISYADDSSGWSAQNWLDYASDGIVIHGNRMVVRDNLIYNTAFALDNEATNSLISKNKIKGFRGDGMRGQGDYTTFEYNDVRNCVQVDGNHADGFQAFTMGPGGPGTGTITGVHLIGNTFIDNENMSNPLKCQLQGIGLFDGMYVDWVIENNLIVTDHYHGISIYGSVNAIITNNTVIDHDFSNTVRPWIMITAHTNGTPSVGGIIRNNISYSVSPGAGTTSDHNLIVNDASLATVFVNPANLDFRLKAGSPAIDAGTTLTAPAFDLLGLPRSIPNDLGAYNF